MFTKKSLTGQATQVQRPLSLSRDDLLQRSHQSANKPSLQKRTRQYGLNLLLLMLALGAMILLVSTKAGATGLITQSNQLADLNPTARILAVHPVPALAGGYLQIHAQRGASNRKMYLRPTVDCGRILSPATYSFHRVRYAYLYSGNALAGGLGGCTLGQILARHGRPSRQITISGAQSDGSIVILFYDQPHHVFIAKHKETTIAPPVANVAPPPAPPVLVPPLTLQNLPNTQCATTSIMNIVAHEDDDILFMNPDTLHDIRAGNCVHSVYLTAGDDGGGRYYWLSRQKGVEAAYGSMIGHPVSWARRTIDLGSGRSAIVAAPVGNPKITLFFLNLPDGNLDGSGFSSTGSQSLTKLLQGTIPTVRAVDGQSVYDSAGLITTLADIISAYHPSQVRTQADDSNAEVADHSDHIATGKYVAMAVASQPAISATSVIYYQGYPIRALADNLSVDDISAKSAAFFAYAAYDFNVCDTAAACTAQGVGYDSYLSREYTLP